MQQDGSMIGRQPEKCWTLEEEHQLGWQLDRKMFIQEDNILILEDNWKGRKSEKLAPNMKSLYSD